jgi:CDP-glycerol:poly(glycerophosphate) glycerophosphotransferase
MVFYVYDLDEYRDQVRGFYFDLEKEAPGPLVTKPAALVGAVRSALQDGGTYHAAYPQFRQKYCSLDDGRPSARLVDAVFRSGAGTAQGATEARLKSRSALPRCPGEQGVYSGDSAHLFG